MKRTAKNVPRPTTTAVARIPARNCHAVSIKIARLLFRGREKRLAISGNGDRRQCKRQHQRRRATTGKKTPVSGPKKHKTTGCQWNRGEKNAKKGGARSKEKERVARESKGQRPVSRKKTENGGRMKTFPSRDDDRFDERKNSSNKDRQRDQKRQEKIHALLRRKRDVKTLASPKRSLYRKTQGPENNGYQLDQVFEIKRKTRNYSRTVIIADLHVSCNSFFKKYRNIPVRDSRCIGGRSLHLSTAQHFVPIIVKTIIFRKSTIQTVNFRSYPNDETRRCRIWEV